MGLTVNIHRLQGAKFTMLSRYCVHCSNESISCENSLGFILWQLETTISRPIWRNTRVVPRVTTQVEAASKASAASAREALAEERNSSAVGREKRLW